VLKKAYKKIKKYPLLWLFLLSFAVHMFMFGYPKSAVFDEVYFNKFPSYYQTGEYYFDIHPPLGKLILAGARVAYGNSTDTPDQIGEAFTTNVYLALRLIPMLCGIFLPLIMYALARQLGISKRSSMIVGLLTTLDNGLLVSGRLILMDVMWITAAMASATLFISWCKNIKQRTNALIIAALLLGVAVSIKWIALGVMVPVGLYILVHYAAHKLSTCSLLGAGLLTLLLSGSVYVGSFALHFALLPKSGPGDAYMSQKFQRGEASFLDKFIDLNSVMFTSNKVSSPDDAIATHPYASKFQQWPVMSKPILYAYDDYGPGQKSAIYMVGNPVVWWVGAAAIFMMLWLTMSKMIPLTKESAFVFAGYIAAWLPFALITRALFLYHYLLALCFAILAVGYMLDRVPKKFRNIDKIYAALIVAGFLIVSPVTYGYQGRLAEWVMDILF
jgi:dolichyl-phosphate-mannose-protein mannosyltransferase